MMITAVSGEHGTSAASVPTAENFSRWELLAQLLAEVVERYEPQAARVLRGDATNENLAPRLLARTLQAQGILFQLLAIAEQNRDMRNRRELERKKGHGAIKGTFAAVLEKAAHDGISGEQIQELLR